MRRAVVLAAALTLQHAPDLVRYGSKPSRETERFGALAGSLRPFEEAVRYPPHQVFIGNRRPEELWRLPRPWWDAASDGAAPAGPFGELIPQSRLYGLMEEMDQFGLVHLGGGDVPKGALPLFDGAEHVGYVAPAHELDAELQAPVLLENIACKAGGVHALRWLLTAHDVDPASIDYTIGCGEEAVGDRYQRGGGAMGKAIAEAAGLTNSGGSDVKVFCSAPVHALVEAGALVQSGAYDRVAVVAGGSLAKLGMKSTAAIDHGVPVLDDVLAGMAVIVGSEPAGGGPSLRLDAVGRHRIASGESQQKLLEDIVVRPLERMGRRICDIDRYATELHDPEITEPAGGGNVPDRNYRMLGGMAVLRGEIDRDGIDEFVREHGMPGFAPTQGHIASAVPWLPHALERFRSGELRSTMLMAKGSLFLGRMTHLWDGASVTMEV